MKLALRGLALGLALTTAACSGGGGGGGGSSSTRKGTGYLKVDLPQMTGASSAVVASSIGTMSLPWAESASSGTPALTLKQLVTNTNQGENCVGIVESIPFLVCMVESMGINKPGTYSGTLGGVTLTAVVAELSADPNGYDIEAVVTKSGKDIFNYKANTAGTKGEIRYELIEFFDVMGVPANADEVQERANIVKWDNTDSANAIVETWEEYHSVYMNTTTTKWVAHMKALVDEDNGIADIVQKQSSHGYYSAITESRLRTTIFQTRFKGSHIIEAFAVCDEGGATAGAVVLGTNCWDFDTNTGVDNPSSPTRNWRMGNPAETGFSGSAPGVLVGGTWNDTSGFSLLESKTLTPSIPVTSDPNTPGNLVDGNQTWSSTAFADSTLTDLVSAQRGGSHAFTLSVGTTQSGETGNSVAKLVQDVQTMSFATMDALISGK
ncbi:MAG: hypothetical protein KF767_10105 [Bdellovibrionaceae bacterium]|nr:hypothetical protein [Pseudobdellovibrionaceae bacterium]